MNSSLEKLVDQIESQRSSVLQSVRGLTTEQLNRVPAPGKWSAAEVLSHVITAERMSVAYMQKKIHGIEKASRSGAWEDLKLVILKVSQRLPGLKFKAPKRVVENTTLYRDFTSIETEWEKVRKDLRKMLDQIPEHGLKRMIYKHPIVGYLNVRHAVIFFHEHLYHHIPQIKKLLK